jgi:hypothetical protein
MATVLVCYAAGPRVHLLNQQALVASARRAGVDRIIARGPWPADDAFVREHRALLDAREGAGFWLWKPRCILAAMEGAAEGDVIVYADAGSDLRRSLAPLVHACTGRDGVLFWNDYPNQHYVKRDCFVLTGTDLPRFHLARQLDAALLLFRNTSRTQDFVREWLHACTDPRLVSDAPNTCGRPNLAGFVGHRHDQAVLTLLYLRAQERLNFKLYARRVKYRYLRHHRRRTPWLPIWLWHAIHDGGGAWLARSRQRLRVYRKLIRRPSSHAPAA